MHDQADPIIYDLLRKRGFLFQRKVQLTELFIRNNIGQKNKLKILDLGCGTGAMLPELAFRFPDSEFWGVDINAKEIGYAQASNSGTNINYLVSDICTQPIENRFDLIFSFDVLHHFPKDMRQTAIKNISLSMREGGAWLAVEPNMLNIYMLYNQAVVDENLHYVPWEFAKIICKHFKLIKRGYCFAIPPFISNPPKVLRFVEKVVEGLPFVGASMYCIWKKN